MIYDHPALQGCNPCQTRNIGKKSNSHIFQNYKLVRIILDQIIKWLVYNNHKYISSEKGFNIK